MLLEKPNYLMNRNTWLEDVAVKNMIYGSTYISKGKQSTLDLSPPKQLMNLSNSELKIHYTGKIYNVDSIKDVISKVELPDRKISYTPDELIIFRRPNPNNPTLGLSVIESVLMEVSNVRGAKGMRNTNIFDKGGTTILSPSGQDSIGSHVLEEDEKKDLEKQFVSDYGGVGDKKRGIKFSKKPIDVNHISYPIKESMLFEEVSENFLKVIDTLGLSKHIFNIKDTSKVSSNIKEGLIMSYQDGIMPFAEKLCFAINDSLGLFDQGLYVELDYSHLEIFKEIKKMELNGKIDSIVKLVKAGYTTEQAEKMVDFKTA
jgi:phage portal protein BeeE